MPTLIDLRREYFDGPGTVADEMRDFFGGSGTLADREIAFYEALYPLSEGNSLLDLRREHYLTSTTGTSASNTTAELEYAFYEQELA